MNIMISLCSYTKKLEVNMEGAAQLQHKNQNLPLFFFFLLWPEKETKFWLGLSYSGSDHPPTSRQLAPHKQRRPQQAPRRPAERWDQSWTWWKAAQENTKCPLEHPKELWWIPPSCTCERRKKMAIWPRQKPPLERTTPPPPSTSEASSM